ncbi:unnamed protein product [Peniophora sp. CBMAI 1063]|nr:unnamed protein product [Peniophora sp. CBMAI 1063]
MKEPVYDFLFDDDLNSTEESAGEGEILDEVPASGAKPKKKGKSKSTKNVRPPWIRKSPNYRSEEAQDIYDNMLAALNLKLQEKNNQKTKGQKKHTLRCPPERVKEGAGVREMISLPCKLPRWFVSAIWLQLNEDEEENILGSDHDDEDEIGAQGALQLGSTRSNGAPGVGELD